MFFHTTKYDPSTAPSTEDLAKVEEDKVAKGVWAGWGYYWSMKSKLFRTERPFWIKIIEDGTALELFPNPLVKDAQVKIKTADLKFNCEPNKICSLEEFKVKFGSEEDVSA